MYIHSVGYPWYVHAYTTYIPCILVRTAYTWNIRSIYQAYTENQGSRRQPTVTVRTAGCRRPSDGHALRGKVRKLCVIAGLKGLRLVHFFRGPLKESANAISGSPQAAATWKMMAIQTPNGVTAAKHSPRNTQFEVQRLSERGPMPPM